MQLASLTEMLNTLPCVPRRCLREQKERGHARLCSESTGLARMLSIAEQKDGCQ